ncbi:hypothetical protein C8A03DRAFT_39941 [Achaetomium macrosporum]|uniref:Aminoglycoside phosphotransferase domain-containing protein n=1 Tax=Achaetomium macrosporum TaxID=79813 RepID=A0AAN7CKM9_9PEZI|nr:hypothetical protein C8A03DRAFT_39941 [Achaetomium macrosporum]
MAPSFEEFDETAWDYGEEVFDKWREGLYDKDLYYAIVKKVVKHHMGEALEICRPQPGGKKGGKEGPGALIRFPMPAYFQYAEERLMAEVAAMRYISENTTIPIPFPIHYGMKQESPGGLGPFIIMDWVENAGDLVDVVNKPGLTIADVPMLDPNIDEEKLERVYYEMADIVLQLSLCEFPALGPLNFLGGDDLNDPEVLTRPLSINISQLANFARVPHFHLPPLSKTFKTSSEYYRALADMHLQQLSFQRNQAIESADDCRKKYIARQLFRRLAAEGRLANPEFDHGPFKLWCDDFRPANVLVKKDGKIAAAIDWEFTYAALADFSFAPPWWLLLQAPDDWRAGLDDWVANYEPKLALFLRALEKKEKEFIEQGRLQESDILLSTRMRKSWETGHFWVTYAARRTWAFDAIYWRFLDEKFFGKNWSGDFLERLKLLPPEQVDAMESFVERKLKEKEEKTIVDWYEPGAEAKLPPDILGRQGQ